MMNLQQDAASNDSHLPNPLKVVLAEVEKTATLIQAEVEEASQLLPPQFNQQAISTHSLMQNLLYQLLDCVRQVLRVDTSVVLLCSKDRQYLTVSAACGLEEEVTAKIQIPVGYGFAGSVAAKRELVVVDDLSQIKVVSPILRNKGLQSMVGIPIMVDNQVIGVFHVGTYRSRQFGQDEVQLLKVIAARIGVVIERIFAFCIEEQTSAVELTPQKSHQLISFQLSYEMARKFCLCLIGLSRLEYLSV
ncbi:GAF domain-containing protein [Gloeocapsa sp. BRSZ]